MDQITDELLDLNVDYDAGNTLKDTVRWTRFISIIGFIGVGLLIVVLLVVIFAGESIFAFYERVIPNLADSAWIVITLLFVLILICGFFMVMLARFSRLTRKAIETQDQEMFTKGLNALRIYFLCCGIAGMLGILSNIRSIIALF